MDGERVDLEAYQLKNIAKTWYNQWREGRDEDAPPFLKKLSWGISFPEN